jgi:hypothetical protein
MFLNSEMPKASDMKFILENQTELTSEKPTAIVMTPKKVLHEFILTPT